MPPSTPSKTPDAEPDSPSSLIDRLKKSPKLNFQTQIQGNYSESQGDERPDDFPEGHDTFFDKAGGIKLGGTDRLKGGILYSDGEGISAIKQNRRIAETDNKGRARIIDTGTEGIFVEGKPSNRELGMLLMAWLHHMEDEPQIYDDLKKAYLPYAFKQAIKSVSRRLERSERPTENARKLLIKMIDQLRNHGQNFIMIQLGSLLQPEGEQTDRAQIQPHQQRQYELAEAVDMLRHIAGDLPIQIIINKGGDFETKTTDARGIYIVLDTRLNEAALDLGKADAHEPKTELAQFVRTHLDTLIEKGTDDRSQSEKGDDFLAEVIARAVGSSVPNAPRVIMASHRSLEAREAARLVWTSSTIREKLRLWRQGKKPENVGWL